MFTYNGLFFDPELYQYSKEKDITLPPMYCKMMKEPNKIDAIGTLNIHLPNGEVIDITYGRQETGARLRQKISLLGVPDIENYMIISSKGFIDDETDVESLHLPNKCDILLQKNKPKFKPPIYLRAHRRRNSLPKPTKPELVNITKSEMRLNPHKCSLPLPPVQTFPETGRK